jgi:NADPH2:quinone reductase
MKAAAYAENGPPEVLEYQDVPDPEASPHGVVIEVRAIGIQGGDVLNRAGGAFVTSPHVVGYQAAGVVRSVGERATRFQPGDRVVGTAGAGSHAELFAVPEATTWAIPDGLSFEQAAGVPVEYGTAHDCLFELGHLQAGETVLVQAAAGGVGIAAVQLAKAAGATVIGTASSAERLERLKPHGLDVGVDYVHGDLVAEVMAATDRRGVDLVVDSVGGSTLERSIACLAYRGRVSWVGQAGREQRPPQVWQLMQGNATLTGVFLGAALAREHDRAYGVIEECLQRAAKGELEVVVDSTFPLAEAAAAHRHIESRQAFGRVVLVP